MTNIDRAAEVLADWVLPGVPPEVIAQALADAGLLMPDLPEPTYITENAVVWKNDGDEVFLDDGEICIASAIRSPERSQRLVRALLAAANYAERNQE